MRIRPFLPLALAAFAGSAGISFWLSTPARAQQAAAPPAAASSPTTTAPGAARSIATTYPPVGSSPPAAAASHSGTTSPPTTLSLASASVADGRILFEESCASCHGPGAAGSNRAPNLVGLGPATVDFWVSTGRMPLAYPSAQAIRKPPRFTPAQSRDISKFVASLGPGGPGIPVVDLKDANIARGFDLFVTNCAACHTISGAGDALSNGLYAPPLTKATPTQVAEAMRTGPGNMPRFGPGQLTPAEVNDVVDYVTRGAVQHPDDRGGLGLGHVGPVTEGFVALFFGLGSILVISYWIGDRSEGVDTKQSGKEPAHV